MTKKDGTRVKGKVYEIIASRAAMYILETVAIIKKQVVAELNILRFPSGVTRIDTIRN